MGSNKRILLPLTEIQTTVRKAGAGWKGNIKSSVLEKCEMRLLYKGRCQVDSEISGVQRRDDAYKDTLGNHQYTDGNTKS